MKSRTKSNYCPKVWYKPPSSTLSGINLPQVSNMLLSLLFYLNLFLFTGLVIRSSITFSARHSSEFARHALVALGVLFPLPILSGFSFGGLFVIAGILVAVAMFFAAAYNRVQFAWGFVIYLLLGMSLSAGFDSGWAFILKTILIATGLVSAYRAYRDWEGGDRETLGWHARGVGAYFGGWSFMSVSDPEGVLRWGSLAAISSLLFLWPIQKYRFVHGGLVLIMLLWMLGISR